MIVCGRDGRARGAGRSDGSGGRVRHQGPGVAVPHPVVPGHGGDDRSGRGLGVGRPAQGRVGDRGLARRRRRDAERGGDRRAERLGHVRRQRADQRDQFGLLGHQLLVQLDDLVVARAQLVPGDLAEGARDVLRLGLQRVDLLDQIEVRPARREQAGRERLDLLPAAGHPGVDQVGQGVLVESGGRQPGQTLVVLLRLGQAIRHGLDQVGRGLPPGRSARCPR